jgi:hypothetical protein
MLLTINMNNHCGQKARTQDLIFYVDLIMWLFQLSSLCRCSYLSPQTESGPAATSALWTTAKSNRGHEPEVRKLNSPFFTLTLWFIFSIEYLRSDCTMLCISAPQLNLSLQLLSCHC